MSLVGERETHFHRAVGALDRLLDHQAADTEAAILGRLAGLHLRGTVEIEDVLVHGLEQERRAEADSGEYETDGDQALMARFHSDLLCGQPTAGLFDVQFQATTRQEDISAEDNKRQRRARPDVPCVFTESQVFHDYPFPMTSRSHFLFRSRTRISARARTISTAKKKNVKPSHMTSSGISMSGFMLGLPSFEIVAGWCRVFHHSTEYLMIGMLITPMIASSALARSARFSSSMAARSAM